MKYDESANPENGTRLLRGHQMIEDGISPKQITETRFEIPSATRDITYVVSKFYKNGHALAQTISLGVFLVNISMQFYSGKS